LELHHTTQSVNDVSELKLELQAKKEEIARLKAKIEAAESQRWGYFCPRIYVLLCYYLNIRIMLLTEYKCYIIT